MAMVLLLLLLLLLPNLMVHDAPCVGGGVQGLWKFGTDNQYT
jgi:hypothetical protein